MSAAQIKTASKKILIMAGGTGGHIFPALASAAVLQKAGVQVEWLGTRNGMEARLVPEHHYPMHFIEIGGLRGKGLKTLLLLPFKLSKALLQTMKIYQQIKPDVVLGMGGFVTGPGGIVGWLKGVPLVVHEQNAIAGMTNKILFRFATKVLAAFPSAFATHKKLRVIGNPVRKEIADLNKPEQRFAKKWATDTDNVLNILVIGGSLGATALNEKLPQAWAEIIAEQTWQSNDFSRIHIRHQCGEKHLDKTRDNYNALLKTDAIKIEIMPFIDDMAANYAWSDLVICRSGALTVSELAAVGVASLLVPFPYAVDDHQTANAAYLADQGAAFLVPQTELSNKTLAAILNKLDKETIKKMALKARQLSTTDAADIVAQECLLLAGEAA